MGAAVMEARARAAAAKARVAKALAVRVAKVTAGADRMEVAEAAVRTEVLGSVERAGSAVAKVLAAATATAVEAAGRAGWVGGRASVIMWGSTTMVVVTLPVMALATAPAMDSAPVGPSRGPQARLMGEVRALVATAAAAAESVVKDMHHHAWRHRRLHGTPRAQTPSARRAFRRASN